MSETALLSMSAFTGRVAYLVLEAPRPGTASEVHVREIADGLRRRDWQVDVYRISGDSTRPGVPRRILQVIGVQLRLLWRIGRYDAFYLRAHNLALPTAVAARITGRPIVHEINGPNEDLFVAHAGARPFRWLLEGMQNLQYRWADGLIAVTARLADWVREQPRCGRVTVISNGANTSLFNQDARTDRALPSRYVAFCGGLAAWHGVDCMLDAVGCPEWPDDVALVIVGDGPGSDKVREHARNDERILPLGRIAYEEVGGVVAGAIAGLVPISDPGNRSRTGLAPLKLFETLACGTPAIVSDLPGQAEIVREHGCGLIFEPDSARALANCVATLANDPEAARAMGQRGIEYVLAEGSWDSRAGDTDAFLRSVIRGA